MNKLSQIHTKTQQWLKILFYALVVALFTISTILAKPIYVVFLLIPTGFLYILGYLSCVYMWRRSQEIKNLYATILSASAGLALVSLAMAERIASLGTVRWVEGAGLFACCYFLWQIVTARRHLNAGTSPGKPENGVAYAKRMFKLARETGENLHNPRKKEQQTMIDTLHEDLPRSNRAEVRNPILALPAAKKIADLPPEARDAVCELLEEMRIDAFARANNAWKKSKPPLAAYWRATSTYCGHIRKAIRRISREKA